MKALILAGGKGTRLYPTTQFYNKHLIHVYNTPMIMHSIDTVRNAGISDIILSVSKDKPELFMEYLKDGSEFGINLTYIVQNDSNGIAYAINQAKHLLHHEDKFMVYLADNYFEESLLKYKLKFDESKNSDAMILTKEMNEPERYGIAITDKDNNLTEAIEKPKFPVSNKAILGVYFFSNAYFGAFSKTVPSGRGEYEVTNVLNMLIPHVICEEYNNEWRDLGTFDDIAKCSEALRIKYTCNNKQQ